MWHESVQSRTKLCLAALVQISMCLIDTVEMRQWSFTVVTYCIWQVSQTKETWRFSYVVGLE